MGLVTAKEVAQVIKADKFGFMGTAMGWMLMKLLMQWLQSHTKHHHHPNPCDMPQWWYARPSILWHNPTNEELKSNPRPVPDHIHRTVGNRRFLDERSAQKSILGQRNA